MLKLKYLLLAGALVSVFILCINPLSDFDTGYHVRTGEFIATHGFVPLNDIFSYTAPGARWIAHYWLADVVFYFWFCAWNLWGLTLGTALIATLSYCFVVKTALLRTQNWRLISLILVPFSILTYELWVARPQIFSYLFTAVIVYLLERWRKSEYKENRLLWFMPPLFLIWANVHAGVVIGIPIIILYVASHMLFGKSARKGKLFSGAIAAFSILCTLINPNGYSVLAYSSIISRAVQMLAVTEWRSLLEYTGSWQAKLFMALMTVVLLIIIKNIFAHRAYPKNADWVSAGLAAGAIVLPLISIRHVGFFPLLTFPLVAEEAGRWWAKRYYSIRADRPMQILSGALTVLLLTIGIPRAFARVAVNDHILPVGAAQFIAAEDLNGPMFNDAAFGGYFIWKLWPERHVFIDGRNDVYAGDVTSDFLSIMRRDEGWEDLVNKKYKINYFVLYYHDPLYDISSNLFAGLSHLGFRLVYWDDASIILLRDTPENKSLIDRFGYRVISPFTDPSTAPITVRPKVVEELKRALDISPSSQTLRRYLRN